MPDDDVSDLRDVVDAINRLCDTMMTSYEEAEDIDDEVVGEAESIETAEEVRCVEYGDSELVSPEEVVVRTVEVHGVDRWSDSTSQMSPPRADDAETVTSDTEAIVAQCEPTSEMYYTASSEVSLLSDTELPDRTEDDDREAKDDRKECVIAGHVAAMRERFESMTRTNTPCPDLVRSLSPSLEVFRNVTPSPDRLG